MYAEWEKQKGIILIYPHIFCDFKDNLEDVQDCYDNLITEIIKVEELYLIVNPKDNVAKSRVQDLLNTFGENAKKCKIFELETNDIWARDSIAISVKEKEPTFLDRITNAHDKEQQKRFANFGFNGWGLKYRANLDNQLNYELHKIGFFDNMITYDIVLEGGSIDCNGDGILLTNTQCLLEKNRNPHLTQKEIEEKLKLYLGISKVLWLHHGFLLGDDTDSHIDTLARFITPNTIAYIQCTDLNNPHFSELNEMQHELESLAKENNFSLVPLPFCEYYKDSHSGETKEFLPASYANFLFLNENVLLLPIYNKPTDFIAVETLKKALPQHNIIAINCEALIQQYGSLHCVSMQIHE